MELDRTGRRRLRAALAAAAPWLLDPDVGPTTVDAGMCDRCGRRPRVAATCGPAPARTLCAGCVLEVGEQGWCDGHAELADHAQRWAASLPAWWGDAVVLWWVSTGEVRTDAAPPVDRAALPPGLRRALN